MSNGRVEEVMADLTGVYSTLHGIYNYDYESCTFDPQPWSILVNPSQNRSLTRLAGQNQAGS